MNARSKQLLHEVMEFPAEERDAFAAELLENLDAPPDALSNEEWTREIERRAKEVLAPGWVGLSWEDVRADVERTLRNVRNE